MGKREDPTPSSFTTVTATPAQAGFRADRALAALVPHLGRRAAKILFHAHTVRLNGRPADGSEHVQPGDQIAYPAAGDPSGRGAFERAAAPRLTTQHGRQVARLYEDDAVLVLNKPAEIPVHRHQDGRTRRETLEDLLARAYPAGPESESAPSAPLPTHTDETQAGLVPEEELDAGWSRDLVNGDAASEPPSPGEETAGSEAAEETDEEDRADLQPVDVEVGVPAPAPAPAKGSAPARATHSFYFAHRLDQETTGCLLVAKNEAARDKLIQDFMAHRMEKTYWAIVSGEVPWEKKTVQRPIMYVRGPAAADPSRERREGRVPEWVRRKLFRRTAPGLKKGVVLPEGAPGGKACETFFEVEERFRGLTLVRCQPKTGRMHQIRVHLAAEGFPLAYDQLYGRRSPLRLREFCLPAAESEAGAQIILNRLPLHAWKLAFTHPVTGRRVEVEAPLPRDLKEFLRVLRRYRRPGHRPPGREDKEWR